MSGPELLRHDCFLCSSFQVFKVCLIGQMHNLIESLWPLLMNIVFHLFTIVLYDTTGSILSPHS